MRACGVPWETMGTFGGLCGPMGTYRDLGAHADPLAPTGTYGGLWGHMGAYGDPLEPMGSYGVL